MEHDHSNNMWLMLLACGGAFLLILVLPIMGFPGTWSAGIAILAMVGLHAWMMKGHSKHSNSEEPGRDANPTAQK